MSKNSSSSVGSVIKPVPQKITHLSEISNQFDFFFFDMYGLLWDGNDFYEGVFELLEGLRNNGKKVYILSNVTALRERFIPEKATKGLIFQKHYDEVVTSGDVCAIAIQNGLFANMAQKPDYKFSVIGKYNTEMFASIDKQYTPDIDLADIVYLGGVQIGDQSETINHLIPALKKALARNLPAVCANPDLTFMSKDKQLPTQGASGHWYETHGGYVHYIGKPYYNIYDYAFKLTNAQANRSLMAGDTLSTDILGGKNATMKTLLVTKTGLTGYHLQQGDTLQNLFKKEKVVPDFIMDSFAKND